MNKIFGVYQALRWSFSVYRYEYGNFMLTVAVSQTLFMAP